MSLSLPKIPRPQMIQCLCGFSLYDGFTISCEKCARWCHAACFDILRPAEVPTDWQCWICHPRPGINKNKATGLQSSRQSRIAEYLRVRQLAELSRVPALERLVGLVKRNFLKTDQIKIYKDECRHLLTQCIILLFSVRCPPAASLGALRDISTVFNEIETQMSEWAELATVKSFVKKSDIDRRLAELLRAVDQLIFAIGLNESELHDFNFLSDTEMNLATNPINHDVDDSPKIQTDGPSTSVSAIDVRWDDFLSTPFQSYVYENLFALIRREIALRRDLHSRDKFERIALAASNTFARPDPILSLARSPRCYSQLKELCNDMRLYVNSSGALRQALYKDEEDIFHLLQKVLSTLDLYREPILKLKGKDAKHFMDHMQMVLDKYLGGDPKSQRSTVHRLFIKLSETSGILPDSLSIHGVKLRGNVAVSGGGFADIYRASYRNKEVALKRMRIFRDDQERQNIHRAFCREALVWQSLRHPHVLPFLGVDSETFSPYLCMVSPWMHHGTIMRYLSENHPTTQVAGLIWEISQGLHYLHSENIVHGDLRGGNILINDKRQACIADFGLTGVSDETQITHTTNRRGSTRWMAPELHDPDSFGFDHFSRTPASDVYAFACVSLEVYTGREPFMGIPLDTAVMLQVIKGGRPARPSEEVARRMPDPVWDLITRCWKQTPSERPNIRQIVDIIKGWGKL